MEIPQAKEKEYPEPEFKVKEKLGENEEDQEEHELDKTMEKLYDGSRNGKMRKSSYSSNSEDEHLGLNDGEEEQD